MRDDFDEGRLSERRDPLDAPFQDFDWDRICDQIDADVDSGKIEKQLAEAITRIFQVLIPLRAHYLPPIEIGLNVIALAWVLNPAYFEGSPSLRQLARRCGVHAATLARHTANYSRLVGWRNRAQRHAWNFRKGKRSRLRDESNADSATGAQGSGSGREKASKAAGRTSAPSAKRK